ncbi:hypothetical protein [Blattabacterium cuenoti]|uniref:hypothetical protein n=1 Tax=Blattabacterium cuenoti TaxID=1653831 RepID=UPI00311E0786
MYENAAKEYGMDIILLQEILPYFSLLKIVIKKNDYLILSYKDLGDIHHYFMMLLKIMKK